MLCYHKKIFSRTITTVSHLFLAIGYATEEDLLDYFAAANSSISNVLGGIVFYNKFPGDAIPSDPTYSIRLSANPRNAPLSTQEDSTWLTDELFPFYQFPGPREANYTDGGSPGELYYCM